MRIPKRVQWVQRGAATTSTSALGAHAHCRAVPGLAPGISGWIPAAFLFPPMILLFPSPHLHPLQSFPHACSSSARFVLPVAELGTGSVVPSPAALRAGTAFYPLCSPCPGGRRRTSVLCRGCGQLICLSQHILLSPEGRWKRCTPRRLQKRCWSSGKGPASQGGREEADIQGRLEKERAICCESACLRSWEQIALN